MDWYALCFEDGTIATWTSLCEPCHKDDEQRKNVTTRAFRENRYQHDVNALVNPYEWKPWDWENDNRMIFPYCQGCYHDEADEHDYDPYNVWGDAYDERYDEDGEPVEADEAWAIDPPANRPLRFFKPDPAEEEATKKVVNKYWTTTTANVAAPNQFVQLLEAEMNQMRGQ